MAGLPRRIVNEWVRVLDAPVSRAQILRHDVHPEGVDVSRVRFDGAGTFALRGGAHLVSVLHGCGRLDRYAIEEGVHVFVPRDATIEADAGTEVITVTGAPRVGHDVVRDERFVVGCATPNGPLRWLLTPQYLSRRIFLHHDAVLSSKSARPVSWFRTTMFDTAGLPPNDDGDPVFKMSYDHRTEPNFCYDVVGEARVRFAERPYEENRWTPWVSLDHQTTYHLNEPEGCPRNKHEVSAKGGHATLFCMFDPAPTGVEQHKAGAYSSYGPLDAIIGTPRHDAVLREHAHFDPMLDALSMARALGEAPNAELVARFEEGHTAQLAFERRLLDELDEDRRAVVSRWATSA